MCHPLSLPAFAFCGFSSVKSIVNIALSTFFLFCLLHQTQQTCQGLLASCTACIVWSCMLRKQRNTPSAGATPCMFDTVYVQVVPPCAPLRREVPQKVAGICTAAYVGQIWHPNPSPGKDCPPCMYHAAHTHGCSPFPVQKHILQGPMCCRLLVYPSHHDAAGCCLCMDLAGMQYSHYPCFCQEVLWKRHPCNLGLLECRAPAFCHLLQLHSRLDRWLGLTAAW